jgi:hypothetical protein
MIEKAEEPKEIQHMSDEDLIIHELSEITLECPCDSGAIT